MNQNPTVDNDLQKAIDDITNTTNNDPVFADPVAAPSSVPEGDTGELAESVGPFPAPAPEPMPMPVPPQPVAAPTTPAEPVVSLDAAITDFSLPPIQAPEPVEPITESVTEEPIATVNSPATELPTTGTTASPSGLSIREIKTAALHDLTPLVDKLDMSPSQKFNIYRNMFENLRDYTVIELAYQAAKTIPEERERAEALLYLVEAIDKM